MSIKQKGFVAALAILALFLHGTAFAQATYTSTSAKVMTTGSYKGDLFVKWSESGLTPGAVTPYAISGSSTAVYACTADGAMCQAPTAPGDLLWFSLNAGANGTIRQTVAVNAASASACSCPSGALVLYQVSYGNSAAPDLQICDNTNPSPVCAPIGTGYFSLTFCRANNLAKCPPA